VNRFCICYLKVRIPASLVHDTLEQSVLKMADPCLHEHQVLRREKESERERERNEEEFLFHRFNPYTRTCTHTRARSGRAFHKGPRRFSFRGYSPFCKLGKKREREKRASTPVLWPTISNYSALLLPTFLPVAHSDPPSTSGESGEKKKARFALAGVVAEIGAARTGI